MGRVAALALAAFLWTGFASTRATAQDTAPAVAAVEAYMAAANAQDWRGVAETVDPDDLAKMQPFIERMGGSLAEDLVLPSVPDDPIGAFAWFMETLVSEVPMMGEMFGSASGEVIGAVTETDSLVHVVMRSTTEVMGGSVSQVSAVTARQAADGRWLVKLGGQVDALASMGEMLQGFEGFEGTDEDLYEVPPPSSQDKRQPKPRSNG